MCSLETNTDGLTAIGATIANAVVNPLSGHNLLSPDTSYTLVGLMHTCGLYNGSGEFAVKVGIPAKSGGGGGIPSVVPGRLGIAVFSPGLDDRGNSVAGIAALSECSRRLRLRGF